MNLTAGSPARLTRFQLPQQPPRNTQARRITRRDSAVSINMARGFPVGAMATAGGPSAPDSDGRLSPTDNGSWIPALAGLGLVSSRGAGLPIITAAGCLTPGAAAGFTHRPCFMGIIRALRLGASRRWFIRPDRYFIQ